MGIFNEFQVLEHLPRRYESFLYSTPEELAHLQDKQKIVLYGQILGPVRTLRFSRFLNSKFFFRDEKGNDYILKYFDKVNQDYIISKLDAGDYMIYKNYKTIIDKKA